MTETAKKLYRSNTDYIIAGVCGGVGEYLGIDPIICRLIFLALIFGGGSGLFIYIVLALVLPRKGGSETTDLASEVKTKITKMIKEVDNKEGLPEKRGGMMGWVILLAGVYFLINQIFPGWVRIDLVWPVLIILAGVYLLLRK